MCASRAGSSMRGLESSGIVGSLLPDVTVVARHAPVPPSRTKNVPRQTTCRHPSWVSMGWGSGRRSGTGCAKRLRDLLDGLRLLGTDALPVLAVGGGDLAGQGENEAPVVIAFFGGGLALQQRHGVAEVPEPAVAELFGGVITRVLQLGFRRHDLVEQLAVAVLCARFGVGLGHGDGLA